MAVHNFERAVKDLRRFSETYAGIFALAEALESIPSIEQAADESRARLEGLRAQEAAIAARVQKAETEAQKLIDDAKAEARAMKAAVKETSDKILSQLAEKREELATVTAEGDAMTKRRDEIRQQISDLREKLIP